MKKIRPFLPILTIVITAVTTVAMAALCSIVAAILGIGIARPAKGAENGWIAERYHDARSAEVQGDYREAITIYDEIIAYDPTYQDVQDRRADTLASLRQQQLSTLYRQATEAIAQGDLETAIEQYDEILEKDGAYLDAHERRTQAAAELRRRQTFEASREAYTAGHWTEAITICHQLQEKQPTYRAAEVRSMLGIALYEEALRLIDNGQIQEALTLLEEARAYDGPSTSSGHSQALELYHWLSAYTDALNALQLKQYKEAIILLEIIHEADPLFLNTAALLFQAYTAQAGELERQDWQWALVLYDRAVALGGIEDGARQAVRLRRERLAQLHTPTPTATVTPTPTIIPTPTPTVCPYDYILAGPPSYRSDCNRVAVEGYIVDGFNRPVNGVRVKVWWDEAPPDWPLSPLSGEKADGYYEFYLDHRPKDGEWHVAVVNDVGEIASPVITVHTDAVCQGGRQIAIVSWRYTR